jgi:hypothetical protein
VVEGPPSHPVSGKFDDATALLRSLIETRSFRKERLSDQDVSRALSILALAVADPAQGQRRLEALSILGKAAEVSVPIARVVRDLIERPLATEPPPIGSWGNADDRYYLAKAVATSHSPWVGAYAARELGRAEISEVSSRDVWADLAVNRASSLADALRGINSAVAEQLSEGDTALLAYRKLVRITQGLAQPLVTADVPTGDGFGRAFTDLIGQAGGGKGAEAMKAREDAALGVFDLLILILRLRFDALFDSDLYRAAGTVRGWWRPGRPPDAVEAKADRVVELALKGLHILARQGVRDVELRQSLVKSLDAVRVNAAGEAEASRDPSLDPSLSKWLATGQELAEARSNDAVREINERSTDELVGRLLIAVESLNGGSNELAGVADSIEIFEPAQSALLRGTARRVELMDQWVRALASKRQLATFGLRGDLVNYDPVLHDVAGIIQRGSRVRISTPGVNKVVEGRPTTIILKGLVEKP